MYRFKALLMASNIAVAGISNLTLMSTAAQAETYDALCGDSGCSINVDGRGITGPDGFIPGEIVSKWTVGSESCYRSDLLKAQKSSQRSNKAKTWETYLK